MALHSRLPRLLALVLILVLLLSPVSATRASEQEAFHSSGAIRLVQSDASGVVLELATPGYLLEKVTLDGREYDRITISDAGVQDEPGFPNLPKISTLIGIPADARPSLQILDDRNQVLDGNYSIEPAGIPAASTEDLQPGTLVYLPDEQAYASNGLYPANAASIGDTAWLRDQRLLRVDIFPIQYQAASGRLTYHSLIRVQITFNSSLRNLSSQTLSEAESQAVTDPKNPFESVLKQEVLNYTQAAGIRQIEKAQKLSSSQAVAALDTSTRYKISISEDGIYKLSYSTLQTVGADVDNIDPTTFALYNIGRPVGIYVENNDGDAHHFSSSEFILFYGQHFDGTYIASLYNGSTTAQEFNGASLGFTYPDEDLNWRTRFYNSSGTHIFYFSPQLNHDMFEKYTDQNVYWLSVGAAASANLNLTSGNLGGGTTAASYVETVRHEESTTWKTTHFTGEDTFLGEELKFSSPSSASKIFTVITNNLQSSESAVIKGEMVALSFNDNGSPDHHTKFYFNKTTNPLPLLDQTWDGPSRYQFEFTIPSSYIINGSNTLEWNQDLTTTVMAGDDIFMDWFELEYNRNFVSVNDSLSFDTLVTGGSLGSQDKIQSGQATITNYQISGYSEKPWVLNISNAISPTIITDTSFLTGTVGFDANEIGGEKYVTAVAQEVVQSDIQSYTPPSDLATAADYVFITPTVFDSAVQSLATYRQSTQGGSFSTKVVLLEDLINIFGFGIYHPLAIKDFLIWAYANWSTPPTYVMLVGDGTWNFFHYSSSSIDNSSPIYMPPNLEWLDPWQGEIDSSNMLATIVGSDPIPDVLIGRLPVSSTSQISDYLAKIEEHESQSGLSWQKRFIFVADNADGGGDFQSDMNRLINNSIVPYPYTKIYALSTCGFDNHACSSDDIIDDINTNGALVLNYAGHASIEWWASSPTLFNTSFLSSLTNDSKLPIVFSMDCLDGYWYSAKLDSQHPITSPQSMAEEFIRISNNGAVAAFSPTGLGLATGHNYLAQGFYSIVMGDNPTWLLGEAALAARINVYTKNSFNIDLAHTYTVFGDPALESASLPRDLVYLPLVIK